MIFKTNVGDWRTWTSSNEHTSIHNEIDSTYLFCVGQLTKTLGLVNCVQARHRGTKPFRSIQLLWNYLVVVSDR